MIWIEFAVRFAAACAAVVAFYVAWFAYEDEERRLQSKIETWWLQFDDIRSKMVSRQAAFVVVVAQRAIGILDRMFGASVLAKDSIAEALCLLSGSFVSVVILMVMAVAEQRFMPMIHKWWPVVPLMYGCAAAPLLSPRLRLLPRAGTGIFAAFILFQFFQSDYVQAAVFIVAFSSGIALTLFQVAIARYAMRSTIAARSEWPIVLGMVLVYVPAGILLASFLALWGIFGPEGEAELLTPTDFLLVLLFMVLAMCFLPTALWGLVMSIAGLMLLHRVVWPLTSRLLYALPRYRIVQNKAALHAAALALIGIAMGTSGLQSILKVLHLA